MSLVWRTLSGRLRRSPGLILLRFAGLTLAVTLAAVLPTFAAAATEQELRQLLARLDHPLAVVLAWSRAGGGDAGAGLQSLEHYLKNEFPARAGFSRAATASLTATAPVPVQLFAADGRLERAGQWFRLAGLPDGLPVTAGRAPAPGAPEAALTETALHRAGYRLGNRLRVPLGPDVQGPAVELTIVGTVGRPAAAPLAHLDGLLDTALLTSPAFWQSTGAVPAEVAWALELPAAELHAPGAPRLLAALRQLPHTAARLLPGADPVISPISWLPGFVGQMAAARAFQLVMLMPVYLLAVAFIVATSAAVTDHRQTEMAVLRSRGATPWGLLRFYLPESLLLTAGAVLAGLALTLPAVQLMGLCSGFLRLVGRPPLHAEMTGTAVGFALAAAALAEAAALLPVVRASRQTVATRGQAGEPGRLRRSAGPVLEFALLAAVVYGSWRLLRHGAGSDPLLLAMPVLTILAGALLTLRLAGWLLRWADRLLRRWCGPALCLAFSLAARPPARQRALSLMLAVTAGLGLYSAAFARTLERDLAAVTDYRLGADLVLRAVWETETAAGSDDGLPAQVVYREPPLSPMRGLPGVRAEARVQTRPDVPLFSGTRPLGQVTAVGISPLEFGHTARFWPELTPEHPHQYLNQLAREETGALVSAGLAARAGLRPGDRIEARRDDASAPLTVLGVVPHWPGRLPDQGEFLVANLHYLQDSLGLLPYDLWLRLEDGAAAAPVYAALKQREVRLAAVKERQAELARGRREPFRLGIYACLSAGFAVAVLVLVLTYLLNVGLTLQARAKELGVLRAMGMPAGQLTLSLYLEQLAGMGVALLTGLTAGAAAAWLYLPALRQQGGHTLPVRLADLAGDRLLLGAVFTSALLLSAAGVAGWVRRLRVTRALRLGEDG